MQAELSSDDKECQSQRSGSGSSGKKDSLDLKAGKSSASGKETVKAKTPPEEIPLSSEYFESQIISLEPKDISDRALTSFEKYLALVNSMYFGWGASEPTQSLNEVSAQLPAIGNDLLAGSGPISGEGAAKTSEEGSSLVSNDFHYSTLDMLCNPLRVPLGYETWSPLEIAIFEAWIWKFGTDFNLFSKFIKTKSPREITDFYFLWKKTSCFEIWKQKMESCLEEDHNEWVFK